MQAQEIETYLAELGQEMQKLEVQHPIRILLVGGAFMLIQVRNRSTTDDVDMLLKDFEDSANSPFYGTFKVAVQAVANRNKIPMTWINDVIGDFLRDVSTIPEGTLWRKYAMLEVYFPPNELYLALKLLAGRQKDRDDIHALCQQLRLSNTQTGTAVG